MNVSLARKHKFKFNYQMNANNLAIVDSSIYLGVTIASGLRGNKHSQIMTTKATKVLNFIRRNLRKCSKTYERKSMYVTYVQHMYLCTCILCSLINDGGATIYVYERD
jgi:hypothetical protein